MFICLLFVIDKKRAMTYLCNVRLFLLLCFVNIPAPPLFVIISVYMKYYYFDNQVIVENHPF